MSPWQLKLAIVLLAPSGVTYLVSYLVFRDPTHLATFFLSDLTFAFIEVLLVVVIVEELLEESERRSLLGKLNNVIGVFFNEVGVDLLTLLMNIDRGRRAKDSRLVAGSEWKDKDFTDAEKLVRSMDLQLDPRHPRPEDLSEIKAILNEKREFLLRLIESPNLLEHDRFTDMLLAVFHLNDELEYRSDLTALPKSDLDHLANDCRRAHSPPIVEWLEYMKHLRNNYPYLYSLATRTNPLDPNADPLVRS